MPSRPMILRVHFYRPDGQGRKGLASAAHHVDYILDAARKREIMAPDSALSAAVHAQYAAEREGSMGAIGPDPRRPPDVRAAQRAILQAQGPVWRVIVSVAEEDALAMGGVLTTYGGWADACRRVVPEMARQLGLDPANVRWIAAAHRWQAGGERNPHIHLLMWEATPTRRRGKWSDRERREIRRTWTRVLYEPELRELGAAKTAARQALRAEVGRALLVLPRLEGLVSGDRWLGDRLAALGAMLPGRGRLALAYMPPDVKRETEAVVRGLVARLPEARRQWDAYVEAAERYARAYQYDTAGARAKAEAELVQRLAVPVLRAAWAAAQQAAAAEAQATMRIAQAGGLGPEADGAVREAVAQAARRRGTERRAEALEGARAVLRAVGRDPEDERAVRAMARLIAQEARRAALEREAAQRAVVGGLLAGVERELRWAAAQARAAAIRAEIEAERAEAERQRMARGAGLYL